MVEVARVQVLDSDERAVVLEVVALASDRRPPGTRRTVLEVFIDALGKLGDRYVEVEGEAGRVALKRAREHPRLEALRAWRDLFFRFDGGFVALADAEVAELELVRRFVEPGPPLHGCVLRAALRDRSLHVLLPRSMRFASHLVQVEAA